MNARTTRAIELAAAGFRLIRTKGAVVSKGEGVAIILWMDGTAGISGRVYTSGPRVHLEIWQRECVLSVSRVMGAASCEVGEFARGAWEEKLIALAFTPAPVP